MISSSGVLYADYKSMSKAKNTSLTAPFPYFGGKSKVALAVWDRLGNVDNYLEPFGGSLAVLLARPDEHRWWEKKETAGDYSGTLVNFFRAIKHKPEAVAAECLSPVNEVDLTARHLYLVRYENELAEKLAADPEYYEIKAAAWWVWGISAWVGGDWMTGKGAWKPGEPNGPGVYRKMPMIAGSHGGKGMHKPIKGISNPQQVLESYKSNLTEVFAILSNRLLRVRLACGDWKRLQGAASKSAAKKVTGIFLDPPYDSSLRRNDLYGSSDTSEGISRDIHKEVREWALSIGSQENYRIAYCSYQEASETLMFTEAGWTKYHWTASGGYSLQANTSAKENREKEIIWFSPHCLPIS
jgi:site-specific DNA-adenine methylase